MYMYINDGPMPCEHVGCSEVSSLACGSHNLSYSCMLEPHPFGPGAKSCFHVGRNFLRMGRSTGSKLPHGHCSETTTVQAQPTFRPSQSSYSANEGSLTFGGREKENAW